MTQTLAEMAVEVLTTADGREKTALSLAHAARWFAAREAGEDLPIGRAEAPLRPARPAEPALLDPRDVPKRKPGRSLWLAEYRMLILRRRNQAWYQHCMSKRLGRWCKLAPSCLRLCRWNLSLLCVRSCYRKMSLM